MYEEETNYHENCYLKKGKWEAGCMQYTICVYITLLDRSRVNWFQSEFLVEPFCLLLELSSRMISLVICPLWPQLRKALTNIYFLIIIPH